MYYKNKFKASDALRLYITKALKDAHIKYVVDSYGNILTNISGNMFHKVIVQRALCFKQQSENDGIPVYSLDEILLSDKIDRSINGKKRFVYETLDKDVSRLYENYGITSL